MGEVLRSALDLDADERATVGAHVAALGWDERTLVRRALGLDLGPIPQPDAGPSLHVALFEFGEVVGLAWPVANGWRCTSDGAFGDGATVREAYEAARVVRAAECRARLAQREARDDG